MTTASRPVLEVRDLCVSYGKVEAVHKASLAVRPGEIITVIGPNGAGKTTLLGAIIGMLRSKGEIRLHGESLADIAVDQRVARGLILVPEKRELFATMSVEDNLLLGAFQCYRRGNRDQKAEMEKVFDRFPRMKERRKQMAGTLSGGERAMLVLGRALMAKPKVLLLDEPSLGLAPMIVQDIFRIISDLKETGVAILLVEQNARAALQVSNYGYVIEIGEIVLEGPSEQLAASPRVAESYLGGGQQN